MAGSTDANLSGIGHCGGHSHYIVPTPNSSLPPSNNQSLLFNANPSSWDGMTPFENFMMPGPRPCEAWGYPFHTGCWKIFLKTRPSSQPINMQQLFDLLRSFPVYNKIMEFGHNYGNLWGYFVLGVNLGIDERPKRCVTRWDPKGIYWTQMEWHNPWTLPIIDSFFMHEHIDATYDNTLMRQEDPMIIPDQQQQHDDIFSCLPAEVYTNVIQHLSLQCVFRLRQASRTCYNFGLEELFWKSRFKPENETGFIFNDDFRKHTFHDKNGRNWKAMCKYVRLVRHDPALKNRNRIWKLALDLRMLLDRIEEAGPCAGTAIQSHFESNAEFDRYAWITANNSFPPINDSYTAGINPLFHRLVKMPSGAVDVYASMLELSGNTYITGLRFKTEAGIEVTIGYNIAKSEHLISTERIHVAGFLVVADQETICGLAVISASGSVSDWIGIHENHPKRRLVLDSSPTTPTAIKYLKGGFDVSQSI